MNKYRLVGAEPFTKAHGTKMMLHIWESSCAKPDCSNLFTVRTPPDSFTSKAFGRKHCDLHKATRAQCIERAAEVNKKLSDSEVLQIRKLAKEGLTPDSLALMFPASAGTIREIIANRRRKNVLV